MADAYTKEDKIRFTALAVVGLFLFASWATGFLRYIDRTLFVSDTGPVCVEEQYIQCCSFAEDAKPPIKQGFVVEDDMGRVWTLERQVPCDKYGNPAPPN
jgi:hypothetical protein